MFRTRRAMDPEHLFHDRLLFSVHTNNTTARTQIEALFFCCVGTTGTERPR